MYVQGNIEARSRGDCCCGKSIHNTYSDVCTYSCPSHPAYKEHVPYFTVVCGLSGSALFILSQNGTSFGKTVERKMWLFFPTTFAEKFHIPRKIQPHFIIKATRSSYKVPFTLFRF
jgi:hypothetical protein